ncbi:MAG: amidohydrolase family protein, partial [Parasporobacterium sp.]|nr:amidohydrolase family protein [Parasporobacterium sp.]
NMDRNAPASLTEQHSAEETEQWLLETCDKYEAVKPILTPRFVPSCTDELLAELGRLQKVYQVPVQSHLSENLSEIELVKQLCPWSKYYGQVYDRVGLFGGEARTVMAHCVYSGLEEIDKMKAQGVFIAHCPQSNINVASGIAPIRKYLDKGMNVGLGSDVAGGAHISMFRAMTDAIQVSKLYWRIKDQSAKPITMPEAFYLATIGGGSFWGKVGSFEKGFLFDAVVISDSRLPHPQPLRMEERLERVVYLSDDRDIMAKYVNGRKIL